MLGPCGWKSPLVIKLYNFVSGSHIAFVARVYKLNLKTTNIPCLVVCQVFFNGPNFLFGKTIRKLNV